MASAARPQSPSPEGFSFKDHLLQFGQTEIDLQNFDYFSVWLKDKESRVTLWGNRTAAGKPFSTVVYCETVSKETAIALSRALLEKQLPEYPLSGSMKEKEIGFINPLEWGKGNQWFFEVTNEKVQRLFLNQKTGPERKAIESSSKDLNDWASGRSLSPL